MIARRRRGNQEGVTKVEVLLAAGVALSGCNVLAPLRGDFGTPENPTTDVARVELGRRLFHERALSADGTRSCASCHDLRTFGQDNQPTSTGIAGTSLRRNTPTVFNAAGHFTQFWDGRSLTVETQALGPILSPVEMGMTDEAAIVTALTRAGYQPAFAEVFSSDGPALSAQNVGRALGAFERTLATRAPLDDFLEGAPSALTVRQRRGFERFNELGCVNCHAGRLAGGGRFERLGVARPWPVENDLGRFEVTHDPADRLVFKIPSLRNVAMTAPYFHDGSVATLPEAVTLMARHQLGVELDETDVADVVEFLQALTGAPPTLPLE